MTPEESRLLMKYLTAHGEIGSREDATGFLCWWLNLKVYGGSEGEAEYKHALDLARTWEVRYWQGYRDALAGRPPAGGQSLLISDGSGSLEWTAEALED